MRLDETRSGPRREELVTMMTETSDVEGDLVVHDLALPAWRVLAEYLLDPCNRFEPDAVISPNSTGTIRLDSYVRFSRRVGHRRGTLAVDVRADGSVWLTRFGHPWWRVIFDSPGNRRSVAHVPAVVIVAAIRAAIDDEEG